MKELLQRLENDLERLHDRLDKPADRLMVDVILNRVRDELAKVGG